MAYYTPDQEAAVKKLLLVSNYYEILGLTKHCTQAQLTQAWKRLALQFHPDKNQAPGSTEATKAINRAYDVLSDPQKREEYDEELRESERKERQRREDLHRNRRPVYKPTKPKPAQKSRRQKDGEFSFCFVFICFLPLLICVVPALIPAQSPVQHTRDHERGLHHLWGREALDKLRRY